MFAVFERGFGKFVVGPHGRYHGDQVDFRREQQFLSIAGAMNGGIGALYARQRLGIFIADRDDRGMLLAMEVADDIWSPVAEADDTNF
jgi:hypothetical protein